MPEGPEVQQVLNSLEPKIIGKQIIHVEVYKPKITIPLKSEGRQDVFMFRQRLEGAIFHSLERRGKYLVFHCMQQNSSTIYMVSHLGMTGGFFNITSFDQIPDQYRKHVHIIFALNNDTQLVYSDQRRFGWVGALTQDEYLAYEPVQNVGPDPSEPDAEVRFLENIRKKQNMNKPIKSVIMQPFNVQGVGNIYAAECLFLARIHPLTPVKELSDEKLLELLKHIKETFKLAIELGGSSIRDYVNSEGKKGTFQELHRMYNKKTCPECGGDIENIKIDSRSSFFCPNCQKMN
ncbi:bifunctional DNA-formamidopyrimidine glycosylase/DNA-(apurinic or apyrimidinic site) lyase [Neobacillus cucumis]|uniref:bifunctional DNA-formamidopyrimidine glycosylase/DNA-(apurinic or apyrimidinic site) lyase n=1 Tax=Neobacillus cucumis TaxID=1740721 RepID=UPI0028533151|nr:bifunctional DNA-formamidopyrimidine glycosylase/DNA-(apurinic or apyrimidinic site) lyase [Neobacillus cucumis]MDR4948828.1 bifunctional DNA-formamidopyrimidine glycosylase/DNA-(apurinic or apyrimidinic site) lyase [Neobacillus cucumis]